MSLAVYFPREMNEPDIQYLLDQLDGAVSLSVEKEIPNPANYQVLVAGRPTKQQLEASPQLSKVVIPWAGVPEPTHEIMKEYPHISVYNLHHNAEATAETALMLLFAAAKRIIPIEYRFRQHDWRPRYQPNPALLLRGKTILILGFGRIGRHVARVCQPLGMQVLGIRRSPHSPVPEDIQAELFPYQELRSLLPRANILMITAPLTEETRGMIGTQELSLLPPNAILVNVGRGAIVDQQALYQALKQGSLHSAGIDVWYNYPEDEPQRADTPPADFPFHELDNIVMSPHRGGGAQEIERLRLDHLANLLNGFARGEDGANRVDLERGY